MNLISLRASKIIVDLTNTGLFINIIIVAS